MNMKDFRNLTLQEKMLYEGIHEFSSDKQSMVTEALQLAKQAHKGQERDEGDPYIIHPIRVANTFIYNLGITDVDTICAALLHDVVEDSDVSFNEIEKRFGKNVEKIVVILTRDKQKETKEEKLQETLRASKATQMLKACDWLDNLRSMPLRTDRGKRWHRHIKETKEMYIPLAEAVENKWLINEMAKAYKEAQDIS